MKEYSLKTKTTPLACEPDGRFSALQIDLSLGYVWCVNQDTGLEIYGTRQLGGAEIRCPGTERMFILYFLLFYHLPLHGINIC